MPETPVTLTGPSSHPTTRQRQGAFTGQRKWQMPATGSYGKGRLLMVRVRGSALSPRATTATGVRPLSPLPWAPGPSFCAWLQHLLGVPGSVAMWQGGVPRPRVPETCCSSSQTQQNP